MNKSTLTAASLLALILLVGGVVWYGGENREILKPTNEPEAVIDGKGEDEKDKEKEATAQPEYDFTQDLDVSKWATYESEKVGVRIRYPKNWEVLDFEDEKAGFALRSPGYVPIQSGILFYDGEIYVNDHANLKQLSIKDLFQTFDDGSGLWFSQYDYENIKIMNWNAVHFPEMSGEDREDYFITYKKTMFSFGYSYLTNQKNPLVSQILRKIVENFEPLK